MTKSANVRGGAKQSMPGCTRKLVARRGLGTFLGTVAATAASSRDFPENNGNRVCSGIRLGTSREAKKNRELARLASLLETLGLGRHLTVVMARRLHS